jgi:hypothetical protein
VTKLTSLVIGCALVAGCKDNKTKPTAQTGSAAQPASDPAWAQKLPSVSGGETALLLKYAIGLVRIDAAGKLQVAEAPRVAAADPRTPGADPIAGGKPVELGDLGNALGLPPIVPRPESALGVVETAGSGSAAEQNPADLAYAKLGHPVAATGSPVPPKRMTGAFALNHPNDVSGGVIVFADASAPATALVEVLAQTGGFLAVRNGDKLGALPIALDRHAPAPGAPGKPWFEVRLGAGPLELEAVPSKAIQIAAIEKLGEAVKAANATAVDVLVGPQNKVQEVVSVVEQLRGAGVEAIGLGWLPGADGGTRGDQGPRLVAWDFYMADTDKDVAAKFKAALEPAWEPMRTCYRALLAKPPEVSGTATLEVFVGGNGKVAGSESRNVSPAIANCAATAVKPLQFPMPPTPGGAKLSVTIAFLPR